ncbi:galanin receptor 2b-like [Ptychodera flava]|uniref:galanin receptor 2b-like n=1 Tax=Ptychodera flava TaxID=63121 RepID=UPI00396AAE89
MTGNHTNETETDSGWTDSSSDASKVEIILDVFYGIIGVLGVTGNLIVILVVFRVKTFRSLTNVLIAHQSIIDMLSSFLLLILNLGPVIIAPPGVWGSFLCKVWISRYLMWAVITVSTLNLVAITMERYFAIVHPIRHHNSFNMKKVKIIFLVEWLLGILVELYWALIQENYNGYCIPIWPSLFVQYLCGTMVFAFQCFIPIAGMAFAYVRIAIALSKQAREGDSVMQRSRRNVIKTLVLVVIAYAICWTPNAFAFYQYNLGGYLDFNAPFTHYTTISAFANMCINPLIYAWKYDSFREGLKKIFCNKQNQVASVSMEDGANPTGANSTVTTTTTALQLPQAVA